MTSPGARRAVNAHRRATEERRALYAVVHAATTLRAALSVSHGSRDRMRGVWFRGGGDPVSLVEDLDAALAALPPGEA